MSCTIPVVYLKAEPFLIAWAGEVYVKVQAINSYGSSMESEPGNGARLETFPNPPINLQENVALRTSDTLGIMWDEDFDGGTAVIDYTVQYDQGLGVFTTIATGVTERAYTITGLTISNTYSFRIKSRNSFGTSQTWSEELQALCAGPPLAPDPPTTTATNTNVVL
jgi:hypothetical protein